MKRGVVVEVVVEIVVEIVVVEEEHQ